MRVALKFEDGVCSLTVEAETDQDKALLDAFRLNGEVEASAQIARDAYRQITEARVVLKKRDPQIEFIR